MSLNDLCQTKNPDMAKIKELLAKGAEAAGLEELDSHGVTPLQQAAFRGNAELVRLLLDSGANVNADKHNEGYTSLMFGALSGNPTVVQMLLDSGAKTHPVNKVNRTAAEMAAFVGLKHIVATIKGFVPKSDLVYFTKIQGLETEPRLPLACVDPLHSLILSTNLHPVRVAYKLEQNSILMDKKVSNVLGSMSERFFKKDGNEWLSGRLHFIKYILDAILKNGIEETLKLWTKGRPQDGFKLNLDNFIRSCVREYPFHESGEFRQMVATLAATPQTPPVTDDGAIAAFLNVRPEDGCSACWEPKAANRCSVCKAVVYCDKRCQKLDWSSHKKLCEALKLSRESGDEAK